MSSLSYYSYRFKGNMSLEPFVIFLRHLPTLLTYLQLSCQLKTPKTQHPETQQLRTYNVFSIRYTPNQRYYFEFIFLTHFFFYHYVFQLYI